MGSPPVKSNDDMNIQSWVVGTDSSVVPARPIRVLNDEVRILYRLTYVRELASKLCAFCNMLIPILRCQRYPSLKRVPGIDDIVRGHPLNRLDAESFRALPYLQRLTLQQGDLPDVTTMARTWFGRGGIASSDSDK